MSQQEKQSIRKIILYVIIAAWEIPGPWNRRLHGIYHSLFLLFTPLLVPVQHIKMSSAKELMDRCAEVRKKAGFMFTSFFFVHFNNTEWNTMNAFEGTLFTRLNDSCCTDKDCKQTQSPSTDLNQWGAGWQVFVFSVLRYLFVYRCKCAF